MNAPFVRAAKSWAAGMVVSTPIVALLQGSLMLYGTSLVLDPEFEWSRYTDSPDDSFSVYSLFIYHVGYVH
jgi:hypothetical protein